MPQFNPGEERIAIATFPTKPAGLPCTAELWLASDMTKVATSDEIPFIATGEDQSISLPIGLPAIEGSYPVFLEVFSNEQRIAIFRGDEDVVIKPLEVRTVRAYWKGTGVSLFAMENGVTFNGKREIDPKFFICTATWALYSTFIIPINATITQIEFKLLGVYGYTVCFDYKWTDQKPGEAEIIIAEGTECPPYVADIYYAYTHYTIPI